MPGAIIILLLSYKNWDQELGLRMSVLFKTDIASATRIETGSRFEIGLVPKEFAEYDCFYKNPAYGVSVGFDAIWAHETFPVEWKGQIKQRSVCTAIIVVKGFLKSALERSLGSRVEAVQVENFLTDIYELIIEHTRAHYGLDKYGLRAHVYEADSKPFYEFIDGVPEGATTGPEAIAKSQAKLVI